MFMPNFCTALRRNCVHETGILHETFLHNISRDSPSWEQKGGTGQLRGVQSNKRRYHVNMKYLRTRVLSATLAAILAATIGQELECQNPNQGGDLFPMAWFKFWYLFAIISFFDGKNTSDKGNGVDPGVRWNMPRNHRTGGETGNDAKRHHQKAHLWWNWGANTVEF